MVHERGTSICWTQLNSNNRQLRHQMIQQFAAGSALSGFNHNAQVLAASARAALIATAQAAVNADDGTNAARRNGLTAQLAVMQALTNETVLAQNGGLAIITTALNGLMTVASVAVISTSGSN